MTFRQRAGSAVARRVTFAQVPTALISVYDKTGIADLASSLAALGWRIVSSGGTARVIADAGVEVTDVADITGVPAILDHRVVTLHPKVHGGLLADPTDENHLADMAEYGIEPISLVVVNLYPFGESTRHRIHRHRWSGHGAGGGEEPCPRRRRRRADRLRHRDRRTPRRTVRSRPPPGGDWPAMRSRTRPPTTRRS